jgi:hypothetical protein
MIASQQKMLKNELKNCRKLRKQLGNLKKATMGVIQITAPIQMKIIPMAEHSILLPKKKKQALL